ncbi:MULTISPECIES: ligase-associated DNA damage response exonuclease [Chitinophagaceae]
MAHKILDFRPEGIYCPIGKFYIDPWKPVDLAVITHGHADHARWGMKKYLCHTFTAPILRSRIGQDIAVETLDYNQSLYINGVKLSLHPAGHIIGSCQIRLEYKGKIVVVSGDYKLQNDGITTPFEYVKCHEFITESTFGLPIYNWLTVDQQNEQLRKWVLQNQQKGKTSIFMGYSLGKSQRIMKALEGLGLIYVHYSIAKLNEAYESVGISLPAWQTVDLQESVKHLDQQIVLLPPALSDSKVIKKIPNGSEAICSGWMQVRGARRWRSADAGFAISDHADWQDLLTAVKATEAEKVYVTHGQTAIFSKYLNEIGIEAVELQTEFGNEEEFTESQNQEGK